MATAQPNKTANASAEDFHPLLFPTVLDGHEQGTLFLLYQYSFLLQLCNDFALLVEFFC